jgi:hypothetical protein
MPRLDGTGPAGMGPMTGGGRGLCNPAGNRLPVRPYRAFRTIFGRPRWGLGRGFWGRSAFGRGFWGRGFLGLGRRRRW